MYPGRYRVEEFKPKSVNATVYPGIYRVEGFKPTSVNVTVYPGRYRVEGFKLHQLMLECIQVYIE